ncbi:unnamed protein product [Rotaria sp. Silwood1]|nr:unnamed protein product [Rotaria sp. Silwood1]
MTSSFELDNNDLEIFTLIWLDAEINGSENKQTQNDLRQLSDDFQTFDSIYDCETYIQSLSIDTRIVLIVSGRLGREIVPRIHDIKQIYSIYVYCFDREANLEWSNNYSKIKNVVTTKKELIKQICNDNKKEIYQINNESLYINIYTNNSDDQFIHSQLLIDYLLKMKINSIIDKQFFTLCETKSDEDDLESKILEEFQQNNSSNNSLYWLTKDKLLSKLLIKAFNKKNINLLYLFRSYIRNIYQQLKLYKCSTSIHVYYSYLITDEEFEQLKKSIGKFISINTFLITTFQREKAFLALKQANNSHKILFEIYANPSIDDIQPYADIKLFNSSINQSQILFMLGSIFHIENFSQQDDIWICQMKLSTRIGQYDNAEKYYKYILNELPSNHLDIHIVYRNLGNVAYIKNDYDQSLEYHLKSLEIKKRLFKNDDSNIADSYNCLGIVYFNKNNYKQAINSYEKALKILNSTSDNDHSKIAACLNNISLVYRTEQNYSKALEYYKKVLDIEKKYLSEDHVDLGQTYHNIGALYCNDSNYFLRDEIRYRHRFLPFANLCAPPYMPHTDFLHIQHLSDNRYTASELYQDAINNFSQAKTYFENYLNRITTSKQYQQQTLNRTFTIGITSLIDVESYIRIAKTNGIVLKLLLSGHKPDVKIDFDFSLHAHYPTLKL